MPVTLPSMGLERRDLFLRPERLWIVLIGSLGTRQRKVMSLFEFPNMIQVCSPIVPRHDSARDALIVVKRRERVRDSAHGQKDKETKNYFYEKAHFTDSNKEGRP